MTQNRRGHEMQPDEQQHFDERELYGLPGELAASDPAEIDEEASREVLAWEIAERDEIENEARRERPAIHAVAGPAQDGIEPPFDERGSQLSTSDTPVLEEEMSNLSEAEKRGRTSFPVQPIAAAGLVNPGPDAEESREMVFLEGESLHYI